MLLEEGKRACTTCDKETAGLIISPIFHCPKCNKLWDHTETLYECTRKGCDNIFSRSESIDLDIPENNCPICRWIYGRTDTTKACPSCSSVCEEGRIIMCQECGRWFFDKFVSVPEFSLQNYIEWLKKHKTTHREE